LTRCFTFKDLGVTFDAQFTFNEHIDIIVVSSVKTLGFIFRSCKRFRSESCLRALYFTLVRSKLEYCSIVWSPIYRRGVDALESVQRKFAKYLLFKLIAEFPPRGTPNSVLYDMANLRSLNMRRNDSFLIFLYKIIHGIINSPFLLSQIYFNVPRANLRSGRFFYVPRAVTNTGCFFKLFLFKYKITLSVMQDSSHLTIILCSSVIKIVISQKQKVNRKNNNN
jgi:hypothetical protein